MEQISMTLDDFLDILKRRKWIIILTALVIFVAAACVAFLIPPIYRSTSTILIEGQEIPRDYVRSTVTSYADQRLQSINQQIMSFSRLLEIVNRFKLYADQRKKEPIEEIISRMRKDIKFETLSANVSDPRSGRSGMATLAFTISYEGERPEVVQQVTNVLSSLYLEENLKIREQQTKGASRFIDEEMKRVQEQLTELDKELATFKSRHLAALPEMVQVNMQNLDRIDQDITRLNEQLKNLKEKERDLQSQLVNVPMDSSNPDKARLKELRALLVMLQTRYSNEYPDVNKTKAEIAELEQRIGSSGKKDSGGNRPDNPAYIALSSQLSNVQSDIESAKRMIVNMNKKRQETYNQVAAAPGVEGRYRVLLMERTNTQLKYDDLMRKGMEATVAYGMEKGQLGERFTLIEPGRLPERPVKPNVPAILLIGFFLGICGGVGLATLLEYNNQSARSPEVLSNATSLPVLGCIPEIVTYEDTVRAKKRRRNWIIGVVVAVVVTIVAFHFLVMDLDVFWARITRRLDMVF